MSVCFSDQVGPLKIKHCGVLDRDRGLRIHDGQAYGGYIGIRNAMDLSF